MSLASCYRAEPNHPSQHLLLYIPYHDPRSDITKPNTPASQLPHKPHSGHTIHVYTIDDIFNSLRYYLHFLTPRLPTSFFFISLDSSLSFFFLLRLHKGIHTPPSTYRPLFFFSCQLTNPRRSAQGTQNGEKERGAAWCKVWIPVCGDG